MGSLDLSGVSSPAWPKRAAVFFLKEFSHKIVRFEPSSSMWTMFGFGFATFCHPLNVNVTLLNITLDMIKKNKRFYINPTRDIRQIMFCTGFK